MRCSVIIYLDNITKESNFRNNKHFKARASLCFILNGVVNNYAHDVAYKGPKQVTVTNGTRTESDSRY